MSQNTTESVLRNSELSTYDNNLASYIREDAVYLWPDGAWCYIGAHDVFEELQSKGDAYTIVGVPKGMIWEDELRDHLSCILTSQIDAGMHISNRYYSIPVRYMDLYFDNSHLEVI